MNQPRYRPPGRGRGLPPDLEFLEHLPGRAPINHFVKRDPVSGNFKLHVSSIPANWSANTLKNIFKKCGDPMNIYISPTIHGSGLRWGFVEYAHYREAHNAVKDLNNNVVLNIQVSFAREKSTDDDTLLQFLTLEEMDNSTEPLLDPRSIVKCVSDRSHLSDKTCSSGVKLNNFIKNPYDQETIEYINECLFQKVLDEYKEDKDAKCHLCGSSCALACSCCWSVFYCSDTCQSKDWSSHLQHCQGAKSKAPEDPKSHSQVDGNQKQTNGYRSYENRNNRFSSNQKEKRSSFEERNMKLPYHNKTLRNDTSTKNSPATTPGLDFIDKEKTFLQELKSKEEKIDTPQVKKEITTLEVQKEIITPQVQKEISTVEVQKEIRTPDSIIESKTPEITKETDIPHIKKEIDRNSEQTNQASPTDQAVATDSRSAQPLYPHMLVASKFTTVLVAFPDPNESDAYYVGAPSLQCSLTEMCSFFGEMIDHCEVITPQCNMKGLASYMDLWYRVEITSVTPDVQAYFIDYGNIEKIGSDGLRKCPDTHKDIPNLVHRIKLAKGTNIKYFNLPEFSELSVKPISTLADGTVVVEVEGDAPATAQDTKTTASHPTETQLADGTVVVEVEGDAPATTQDTKTTASHPTETQFQLSDGTVVVKVEGDAPDTVQAAKITTSHPTETQLADSTVMVKVDGDAPATDQDEKTTTSHPTETPVVISKSPSTVVDLLQENWKLSFVPTKGDYVKNSIIGQVFCADIESTISFIAHNEMYQNYLSTQEFDPAYKPNVGEVVGMRVSSVWERGRVLPRQGIVALQDQGGVVRNSQLFKLSKSYVDIPSMASVLTLHRANPKSFTCILEADNIVLDVVKVTRINERTVVNVTGPSIEGVLMTWDYEPLETPDPLNNGDKVKIYRVIDSNTLLVTPDDDNEFLNRLQIDSMKSKKEFQQPPKEGDYVSFFDSEDEAYFRCRIDKVEGDEYVIYLVDDATDRRVKLGDLRPLVESFQSVPCRISQIELKGVDKVNQTEQAQAYLSYIYTEDKHLTITEIDNDGISTLTVEGEEGTLNGKLKDLLNPPVVPDSEGKLTIMSLPIVGVPLNQEYDFIVSHTDPLYMQLSSTLIEYFEKLHPLLQAHCAVDDKPYNPCQGELCLSQYEGDWYRCRCLRETNTGVSVLMLVDYGNIFEVPSNGIRQILPDMVSLPSIAISCKIHGLPDQVPPNLKARLDELLAVDSLHKGVFVAQQGDSYEVVIESVKQAIAELQ